MKESETFAAGDKFMIVDTGVYFEAKEIIDLIDKFWLQFVNLVPLSAPDY